MSNLPSIPWTERERAEFKRRISALEAGGGGGGGGATDLAYTPATRLLASSTGADVTLPLVGSDAGLMSAADKTKLNGVAAGATANSPDATLLDRANHTGTQLAATISDFGTAVDARILRGTATVTPSLGSNEWRETVSVLGMTAGRIVFPVVGAHADTDENDPELLDIGALAAIPGTDTLTFVLNFLTPTQGPIKMNWSAL